MDNSLKLLGLIYRAKKMVLGEEVLNNLKKCKLIFIASDTSDKNKERYLRKCEYYKIKHIDVYESSDLSNALGKNNVKLIGIVDKGFADSLLLKLKEDVDNGKTNL